MIVPDESEAILPSRNNEKLPRCIGEQRIEVIESHEEGNSERKLTDIFAVVKPTQINKILKNKIRIRKEWENFKFWGVKRMRMEKFPEINEALIEWFKSARAKNSPISRASMKQKAMEIAYALGTKDFCASNSWFDKFRVRNNVAFGAL
ncbi:hypothetical protein AVEN_19707-1 [Araneus ventricosus]|uniref:HTH CENPB-type domain-containing protein n=1 Tax=Araneus ventricosus TaxID=182803 RepID=A0A4Y2C4H6_ARAVE|nr:hypothetical protein AVEN_19707-1 [Araneus ventricosus]